MNAKRLKTAVLLITFLLPAVVRADQAVGLVQRGNELYSQGQFDEAIDKYDQALVDSPVVCEPKFNKANSYYRLVDYEKAEGLYKQVAAKSKDMKLVEKAKYNLGNCSFRKGYKQKDSDAQKAIDNLKTGIDYWRQVLDIDPDNKEAAQNIEVARLTIKDILDKQKQQRRNQQKPLLQQEQQKKEQQQKEQQEQQQKGQQHKEQQQKDLDNQRGQHPQRQQGVPGEANQQFSWENEQQLQQLQERISEATADEILNREKLLRKQRRLMRRGRFKKVDKDW